MRYSLFYGENNLRFRSLKGRIHPTAVVQSGISALCIKTFAEKTSTATFASEPTAKAAMDINHS